MEGGRTFGQRSLLVRLAAPVVFVMILSIIFWQPFDVIGAIVIWFLALILNWEIFNCRRILVNKNELVVRGFLGLRRTKSYKWRDVKAARIYSNNYKYHKFFHYKIYLYYKDFSTPKVSLSGMLWFERKMLMKELEKHIPVVKNLHEALPKFKDLL